MSAVLAPPMAAAEHDPERLRGAWLCACGFGLALSFGLAASAHHALRALAPTIGLALVSVAYAAIGAASGALLGLFQKRVLRQLLPNLRAWVWISVLGAIVGWTAAALLPISLPGLDVVIGLSLLTSAQALVRRRHLGNRQTFACSAGGVVAALPLIIIGASVCALEQRWWSVAAFGLCAGWLAGVPYGSMTWQLLRPHKARLQPSAL